MKSTMLAVAAMLLPMTAAAASWQEELTMQMQELKDCKLGFLAKVVETRRNGKRLVMATAHCEDGRQFDVERQGDRGLFTIEECEQRRVC